ncbi:MULTISPECIES: hypothetical protein [unclassified Arenibacter]|jgi:hypothetical protein|nr:MULTISPECIES: hypothetical protein [unclassified Arenibacter]
MGRFLNILFLEAYKWLSGYVLFTNYGYGEKLGNELWDYFEREY